MAIETDSPTLILAIVLFYILHHLIRKYEEKVFSLDNFIKRKQNEDGAMKRKEGRRMMSPENNKDSYEISVSCVYFSKPGRENTQRTLEIAARRADELNVRHVVVATTSGETGLMATRLFQSKNLVIVTHSTGFLKPGLQELIPELRKKIEETGAKVLTCQHAFGGVGRAVRKKLGTYELEEIVAYTLRIFGEGTKVAVELALMAADAGLIPTSEPCIAVGGTAQGADTAILLKPANAQTFFDAKIMEILAKPRFDIDEE
jgi:hypothetical protein